AGADARRSLTVLEAAAGIAAAQAATGTADEDGRVASADGEGQAASAGEDEAEEDRTILITAEACREPSREPWPRYDRPGDRHYAVVSASITSIRGSDVAAALHYLARMIVAGEDPRFIARRIVISAAEDIGMADPQALPIAVAAS